MPKTNSKNISHNSKKTNRNKTMNANKRVNYNYCYSLVLMFLMLSTLIVSIRMSLIQDSRIDYLEDQITKIKKEVISPDSQSKLIQLQH